MQRIVFKPGCRIPRAPTRPSVVGGFRVPKEVRQLAAKAEGSRLLSIEQVALPELHTLASDYFLAQPVRYFYRVEPEAEDDFHRRTDTFTLYADTQ